MPRLVDNVTRCEDLVTRKLKHLFAFSFLVGLCGTFSSGLLAFVLPPAFLLALDGKKLQDNREYGTLFKHISILIGGLVFSIVASIFILIDKVK